jgi:hypothetical protein
MIQYDALHFGRSGWRGRENPILGKINHRLVVMFQVCSSNGVIKIPVLHQINSLIFKNDSVLDGTNGF